MYQVPLSCQVTGSCCALQHRKNRSAVILWHQNCEPKGSFQCVETLPWLCHIPSLLSIVGMVSRHFAETCVCSCALVLILRLWRPEQVPVLLLLYSFFMCSTMGLLSVKRWSINIYWLVIQLYLGFGCWLHVFFELLMELNEIATRIYSESLRTARDKMRVWMCRVILFQVLLVMLLGKWAMANHRRSFCEMQDVPIE